MTDMFVLRKRGRQPRAGVRSTSRLEIVMTTDERAALNKASQDNRQSLSDFVRTAVNEAVAEYSEAVVFVGSGDRFPHQR